MSLALQPSPCCVCVFYLGFMEPVGMSKQRLCFTVYQAPSKKRPPTLRRRCMGSSRRQTVGTHSGCFHTIVTSKQTAWQFLTNTPLDKDSSTNAVIFSMSSLLLLHDALATWCSPPSKYAADTICYIGNSSARNSQNFNLKKKNPYHLLTLWRALKSYFNTLLNHRLSY